MTGCGGHEGVTLGVQSARPPSLPNTAPHTWPRPIDYLHATHVLWFYVTERSQRSGYWVVHFLLGGLTLHDHVRVTATRPVPPLSLACQVWARYHGRPYRQLIWNL